MRILFGQFEKISISANKIIVIMHLAMMTIVFAMFNILYSDFLYYICNQDVIDASYIIMYIFKYNIGGTLLISFMVAVVVLGYCFYVDKRKEIICAMYEQGISKHLLFIYLIGECCIMFLVPFFAGDLLCCILL